MKINLSFFITTLMVVCSAQAATEIPTVFIGDAGNLNGTTDYFVDTSGVTNGQYAEFLNNVAATDTHGLYNVGMGFFYGGITRSGVIGSYSYMATKPDAPVNYVSFWDAARFANWLTTGDTETGVYTLTSEGIADNTIIRDLTAWNNGGVAIASYDSDDLDGINQDENMWEWDDGITASGRGLRQVSSGSGQNDPVFTLASFDPTLEDSRVGFRVTSLTLIPEPSTYAAILGGLVILITFLYRFKKTHRTL